MNSDEKSDGFSLKSTISLVTMVGVIGLLIWLSFNVDVPEPRVDRKSVV